jgi:hypothetical protein
MKKYFVRINGITHIGEPVLNDNNPNGIKMFLKNCNGYHTETRVIKNAEIIRELTEDETKEISNPYDRGSYLRIMRNLRNSER